MEGRLEYTEWTVEDDWQGIILQLGGWMRSISILWNVNTVSYCDRQKKINYRCLIYQDPKGMHSTGIVTGVKLFQYTNHIIQQMLQWGSLLESSLLEGKEGRRIVVKWILKKWVKRISAGPGEGSVMYRVIQNDCRSFNNLPYTIPLR